MFSINGYISTHALHPDFYVLGCASVIATLVKAFDRVSRELLWKIMTRPGVPVKLVYLLKALHKTVNSKFIIDDIEQNIESAIEVKQGDVLGLDFFLLRMVAVLKTWPSYNPYKLCTIRCKADF